MYLLIPKINISSLLARGDHLQDTTTRLSLVEDSKPRGGFHKWGYPQMGGLEGKIPSRNE